MSYLPTLYAMFLGPNISWYLCAEIIFRTVFIYLYAIANIRILNTGNLAQMNAFEFLIIIALGSAVGDPMLYQHLPLIYAMVVITTIILLEKFTAYLTGKSNRVRRILTGQPILLVKNGKLNDHELEKEHISCDELYASLREQGIANLHQVAYAYLEVSGNISIIKKADLGDSKSHPKTSTLIDYSN